jgi:hypothetical protein
MQSTSRQMELEIVDIIFWYRLNFPVLIAVHRRPYEVHIAANECRKTPIVHHPFRKALIHTNTSLLLTPAGSA